MIASALVLAGTRPEGDPLARELGVAHKALIEIDGQRRALVTQTDALRAQRKAGDKAISQARATARKGVKARKTEADDDGAA